MRSALFAGWQRRLAAAPPRLTTHRPMTRLHWTAGARQRHLICAAPTPHRWFATNANKSSSSKHSSSSSSSPQLDQSSPNTHHPNWTSLEQNIMQGLHLNRRMNRHTFRYVYMAILGSLVSVGVIVYALRDSVKENIAEQGADVVSQTLKEKGVHETLTIESGKLVNALLKDPNLMNQASLFVAELTVQENTRKALIQLVQHSLADPALLKSVEELARVVVWRLINDPGTMQRLVDLLKGAIVDQNNQNAVYQLLLNLSNDPKTQIMLSELTANVIHRTLSDQAVQEHATQFAKEVLAEESLQKQGGDALWATLKHTLLPSFLQRDSHKEERVKNRQLRLEMQKQKKHERKQELPPVVPPQQHSQGVIIEEVADEDDTEETPAEETEAETKQRLELRRKLEEEDMQPGAHVIHETGDVMTHAQEPAMSVTEEVALAPASAPPQQQPLPQAIDETTQQTTPPSSQPQPRLVPVPPLVGA